MTYQSALIFLGGIITYLNTMLLQPTASMQSSIGLRTDIFFVNMQQPVNYFSAFLVSLLLIICFANNFICNVVGILYPLLYSITLINSNPNSPQLVAINKYWAIFGMVTLIDGVFYPFLSFIPGYYYLKIAFIYSLIRDDFYMSNYVYDTALKYYTNYIPNIMSYISKWTGNKNTNLNVMEILKRTE